MKNKKVALYARVSTRNNGQDPETQLHALREYATARGWEVVRAFVDVGISGAKESRPELDRLMAWARRRKCDAILVWRFDRFARSTQHLLRALEEFRELRVDFTSLQEGIDTSTAMGKLIYTFLAGIAEFERHLIRERVVAGINRAKAQGKTLGRPRGTRADARAVQLLAVQGLSTRAIAAELGISKSTVSRILTG